MKRILLAPVLIIAGMSAQSQNIAPDQVPAPVKEHFSKQFANAADVEWEIKSTYYEVDFEIGNQDNEIWYHANGQMLQHKAEIRNNELPSAIASAIEKNYPKYRIDDVDRIVKDNTTYYKVDIESFNDELRLFYNESGEAVASPALLD